MFVLFAFNSSTTHTCNSGFFIEQILVPEIDLAEELSKWLCSIHRAFSFEQLQALYFLPALLTLPKWLLSKQGPPLKQFSFEQIPTESFGDNERELQMTACICEYQRCSTSESRHGCGIQIVLRDLNGSGFKNFSHSSRSTDEGQLPATWLI